MKTIRTPLVMILMATAARGDDWPQAGRDPEHLRAPSETVTAPALLGMVATGSPSAASAVASDGYLVTAGVDGKVRVYRENDLSLAWSSTLDTSVIGTPAVDHGRIYIPTTGGILWILGLADGVALGSVATGGTDYSSPVIAGRQLLLGAGFPRNELVAISVPGGGELWSAALDQVTNSSPAISGNTVVIGTNNGTLLAFDLTTHLQLWSASAGGTMGMASPIISGSSVFVLSGGIVTKVDLVSGGVQGTLALADSTGAPPADEISVEFAGSSLARVGGLLMGVVRFDHALDHTGDGVVDAWKLREFAFAIDPATMSLVWQTGLGESPEADVNGIPSFRLVPSPVSVGAQVAFGTSVSSAPGGGIFLIDPATGRVASTLAMDSPCQASPFVANARLYALSGQGSLYAFQGVHAPPLPASGLLPAGTELPTTPATLSWNDSGPGFTYDVRIAHDGEILMDWDAEFTATSPTIPCPTLSSGFLYTWGVRVQDSTGAFGPWSVASFGQALPPQPPGAVVAIPKHQKVLLTWTPSPSPGVSGYSIIWGPTGGALGTAVDLGDVTSTAVTGLVNGTSYTFQVRAVDGLGFPSAPSTATATPVSLITVGGAMFDSLSAALATAMPGQTVQLGADTFTIGATLTVPHDVSLQGISALDTRIAASGPIVMVNGSTGSTVRLLALSGGLIGVNASGTDVTIANCVVRDMADAGVEVAGTAEVINNTIVNNATAGVRASGHVDARNNILQQNGVGFSGAVVSTYNDVSDGYLTAVAGAGDLHAAVAFLNPAEGDFREQSNQPSLDSGAPWDDFSKEPPLNGGRINMGAFGNTPLAAASLTAGPPPENSGSSGGACGLVGLEAVILLALRRRR